MSEINCTVCGNKFEAKRADAKFCSDACRKKAARNAGVNPDTGEILSTSATSELTDKSVAKAVEAMSKLDKQAYDYEANLKAFQKMGIAKVDWLTTGIPELDAFQKIPRGRVTQIQGPYAVGKTTLALNMLSGLKGVKVFYVDSEASLNPELLADLEVEAKNFTLYNESAFIEDVYDRVLEAAKSAKYDLIVIDSLASMTFRTEEEGKSTDRNIGQKALFVNKLMRIVPMILKNTDTALVIINQEREVIGSYVPQKYTPGGTGVSYAASLILALKTIPSWRFPKDAKNGLYKGHEIEVTIAKSKVSQPHRKQKIKLYYPEPTAQEESTETPAF